eukprot:CAMPEP_0114574882 /NCGR_PEP_ID=MMETSP0114-20121206/19639_1 /TAXON_ID=31324 /ORGANISM="Goniomonas sp, Strain m" /LENGTH=232 /DNA_ID=CAMNT_0001762343 /DNA_START=98 /DNA_END=796 /DNA_ORIENTATION=-
MAEKTGRSVILYLHGGAYVFGSAVMYREFTTRISRMTTSDVLCPDYRLAPEHPFPCALRDSLSTYRWLLEELDVPASSVVFAGDSAGGNLVAATLLSLHESKLPNPAGAVLLSPWLDLTATRTYKYSGDPLLPKERVQEVTAMYTAGKNARTPLVSPLFASAEELRQLPPILIHVGSREILLDQIREFHTQLKDAGVSVKFKEWPDKLFLPEAQVALADIQQFIHDRLGKTP